MSEIRFDWRLRSGIASVTSTCVLLLVLASFPLVLHWTGALSVADTAPNTPEHTRAFVKSCVVLTVFLWICFTIAVAGIRSRGKITGQELIGAGWKRWQDFARDLSIAAGTLVAMGIVGTLSNTLLGPLQQDTSAFRAMVAPQKSLEAVAFLITALTAGFVEEFVFRGYIQKQCQSLCGNTLLASTLQVIIFTSGHAYQGWTRLVPVFLIGSLLTAVALWRRSLVPGMIAHGLGDGLVAFAYFAKHW